MRSFDILIVIVFGCGLFWDFRDFMYDDVFLGFILIVFFSFFNFNIFGKVQFKLNGLMKYIIFIFEREIGKKEKFILRVIYCYSLYYEYLK